MFVRSLPVLLAATLLFACSEPQKPNLALACSLTKCTCVSDKGRGYFERNFRRQRTTSTDVLWTDRGEAYCPEGYALQRIEEKNRAQYYTPS